MNFTPAQSAPPAGQGGLPLGILQSVSQPASSNLQASLDYDALRTALQSGNLISAQQAYLRLQNDLELPHLTASTTPAATERTGAYLNVAG